MKKMCTIVTYHYVRPIARSRYPGIRGLELTDFEGQLDYIERHYNVVSVADIVRARNDGSALPEHPLLLSFDDGYRDFYFNAYPILKKYNLPAHHNICPGLIDGKSLP